jgi:hypothetical protein
MWDGADSAFDLSRAAADAGALDCRSEPPQKVVLRSRVVLIALIGMANRRIAHELNTTRSTVIL